MRSYEGWEVPVTQIFGGEYVMTPSTVADYMSLVMWIHTCRHGMRSGTNIEGPCSAAIHCPTIELDIYIQ